MSVAGKVPKEIQDALDSRQYIVEGERHRRIIRSLLEENESHKRVNQLLREDKEVERLNKEVRLLQSELAAKDKVLEWYADQGNYFRYIENDVEWVPEVKQDHGGKARSILSKFKEAEPSET